MIAIQTKFREILIASFRQTEHFHDSFSFDLQKFVMFVLRFKTKQTLKCHNDTYLKK